jgi:hypothetical protein
LFAYKNKTTKYNVDQFTAARLGSPTLRQFAQRLADATKGAILMLWDENVVQVSNVIMCTFSLSATITIVGMNISFKLTTVYGPTRGNLNVAFFAESVAAKPPIVTRWLVTGDFNQMYRARGKIEQIPTISPIDRFRNALNTCDLKEIHLQNRKFT